ncbi:C40 family peptidase [Enterococcus sp. ALS3]|uniref:C40 family peptidase n=1 Tax=Enterococcus alishanensis TaxID=1303817 RepID=A0ABS6TC59_9ENTE|nr:NlpC/P60 family protein [Enterococcus alishanensis]MBV7390498.1 C40 family peptidase [Enterococcus alishanensis]
MKLGFKTGLALGLCLVGLQVTGTKVFAAEINEDDSQIQLTEDQSVYQKEKQAALEAGYTLAQFEAVMATPNITSAQTVQTFADTAALTEQQKVVNLAQAQVGKPFGWGAAGPSAFDASGLVQYVFKNAVNMTVPAPSTSQERLGKDVSMNALQPGDLLFWGTKGNSNNVAIFIGNGQYIYSPGPDQNVKVGQIAWYKPDFAKRILSDGVQKVPGLDGQQANEKYVFRLYNANEGNHHYTQDLAEATNLQNIGWTYEGVAWAAPTAGDTTYRLYNPNNGRHFYTLSSQENTWLTTIGWESEGVSWNSGGNVPVYRVYNPNAIGSQDSHVYTTNSGEKNNLVSLGWKDEGTAWNAERAIQ